jgi:hypothetical protein
VPVSLLQNHSRQGSDFKKFKSSHLYSLPIGRGELNSLLIGESTPSTERWISWKKKTEESAPTCESAGLVLTNRGDRCAGVEPVVLVDHRRLAFAVCSNGKELSRAGDGMFAAFART